MFIRSYRTAFILLFSVALVSTVTAVAYNAYRRATEVSLDLSAEIISEISRKTADRTAAVFDTARGYLEINALVAKGDDIVARQDELLELFWKQIDLTPQLISVYAADARGSFVQVRERPQLSTRVIDRRTSPAREFIIYRDEDYRAIAHIRGEARYDPRDRPWFQTAKTSVSVSDLYRFQATGKPGITVTRALRDERGPLLSVHAADITLENLSEFLAAQRIARGGVAMIVDAEDRLIAFPYQLRLREEKGGEGVTDLPLVDQLAEPWLVDAYDALRAGTAARTLGGHGEYTVSQSHGVRYIAHVEPLKVGQGTDWKLFIVVPQRSLLSAAERLLSESLAISLIILVVAVLVVYFIATRFFQPARRLAHNASLIRDFRLDEVEPVRSRFREVQMVDDAILGLKQGLQTLEKFLPADVIRRLIWSDQELAPGGEMREVALLFLGFTDLPSLTRRLTPERLSHVVTHRLERYTAQVLAEEGTVDRYLSDTLMAFWGAPFDTADGIERACRLALACRVQEDMPGEPHAEVACAIHAGPAIVGSIGSVDRLSYTAIGEHVELGYRLRQLNRHYGTPILVSESARAPIADRFWWRRLDVLPLDGPAEKMVLYELVAARSERLGKDTRHFIERYERGLDALRAARWDEALGVYRELIHEHPRNASVQVMLQRCLLRDALGCPWTEPRPPGADATAVVPQEEDHAGGEGAGR